MIPTVQPATALIIILCCFAAAVLVITAAVHNAITAMNIVVGF